MNAFVYIDVSDPWIAWLAYRGELVAAPQVNRQAISVWQAKHLVYWGRSGRPSPSFRKERELEQFRSIRHPAAVSRLSGLYLFPTLLEARQVAHRWDGVFRAENLTEVEIVQCSRQSIYDSEWITHDFHSPDNSWFDAYFSGRSRGTNPIREILFDGRAIIRGTELRKRAYKAVATVWPQSLGLLELSRVAADLGSDLGIIVPITTVDGNKVTLQFMANFEDAENSEFLKKLGRYNGPKNTKDLNSSSDLVRPDLRHLSTEIVF